MTLSHVFVVYRVNRQFAKLLDEFGFAEPPGYSPSMGMYIVKVKTVVMSEEQAEAEVQRLNEINRTSDEQYFWQHARFFHDGIAHRHLDEMAEGGGSD